MTNDDLMDIPPFLDRRKWTEQENTAHRQRMEDIERAEREKIAIIQRKKIAREDHARAHLATKQATRDAKKVARSARRNTRTMCRKAVRDSVLFDNKLSLSLLASHLEHTYTRSQIKSALRALIRNNTLTKEGGTYGINNTPNDNELE